MKKLVVLFAALGLAFGCSVAFAHGGHGGSGGHGGHHAGQSQPTHGGQDGCTILPRCK